MGSGRRHAGATLVLDGVLLACVGVVQLIAWRFRRWKRRLQQGPAAEAGPARAEEYPRPAE